MAAAWKQSFCMRLQGGKLYQGKRQFAAVTGHPLYVESRAKWGQGVPVGKGASLYEARGSHWGREHLLYVESRAKWGQGVPVGKGDPAPLARDNI